MEIRKGSVVKATAGRDKGGYFAVTDIFREYVMIADGKSRKLSSPKKKNPKHLKITGTIVEPDKITDKELRNVLSKMTHTP